MQRLAGVLLAARPFAVRAEDASLSVLRGMLAPMRKPELPYRESGGLARAYRGRRTLGGTKLLRVKPERYKCPRCKWDFAYRKKRCCPGCGTLLLIASDMLSDAELTELRSFWMWEPLKERWDYIRDWEEHKREAMERFKEYFKARIGGAADNEPTRQPLTKWIQ